MQTGQGEAVKPSKREKAHRNSGHQSNAQECAQAGLELARIEYQRRVKLNKREFISKEDLDRAGTEYSMKRQQVQEIIANLKTAQLGARPDEIKAAEAEGDALKAKLAQAEWNLAQKSQNTLRNGLIFDTLYYSGEWVPPGRPVVSLLPPENVKNQVLRARKSPGPSCPGPEGICLP